MSNDDNRGLAAIAAELRNAAAVVATLGGRHSLDKRRQVASEAAAALGRLARGCERPSALPVLLDRLDLRMSESGKAAVEVLAGYRPDAKGRLVPDRLVKAEDLLEDQTVRRILAYGVDLADQIARFRAHSYDDVASLLDILAEQYGGGRRPGRRGNYSILSYDGRCRVVVQVQDRQTFGPELQAARELIDECIAEWSEGSRDEIRALVQHAFQPDQEGRVNREAVFRLRRLDIDDERWRQATRAIDDSIRITGTRTYLRLYIRATTEAPWRAVPIDIASDWQDPECPETPAT